MSSLTVKSIQKEISGWGWFVLGWIEQQSPVVLLGNAGPMWWQVFSASPESSDGQAHPMDRVSKRLGDTLAAKWQCTVVYPSDGPPYPPFLAWAQASGQAYPSKLGPMIHHRFGLWHAYRAALVFDGQGKLKVSDEESPEGKASEGHPCQSCADQPCLNTCPVNAIGLGRYDIPACLGHLNDQPSDCLAQGCAARRACPVGHDFYYSTDQAEFHMRAFHTAQSQKHSDIAL